MVFPKIVYESLPVVYLVLGVVVPQMLSSGWAILSGLSFAVVALLTVVMRVDYRADRSARLRGRVYTARMETQRRPSNRNEKYYRRRP